MSDQAASWTALSRARYLNLETYRRDGTPIRTPLWFAATAGSPALVAYSRADAIKLKRLRRNKLCRVASCDLRGTPTGPWLDAQATTVPWTPDDQAMPLLNRKYRPWKQMLDLLSRFRPSPGRAVITIVPRAHA